MHMHGHLYVVHTLLYMTCILRFGLILVFASCTLFQSFFSLVFFFSIPLSLSLYISRSCSPYLLSLLEHCARFFVYIFPLHRVHMYINLFTCRKAYDASDFTIRSILQFHLFGRMFVLIFCQTRDSKEIEAKCKREKKDEELN